jgi:hypothetical protein
MQPEDDKTAPVAGEPERPDKPRPRPVLPGFKDVTETGAGLMIIGVPVPGDDVPGLGPGLTHPNQEGS